MNKFNTMKARTTLYFSLLVCMALIALGLTSYRTFHAFTKQEMISNTSTITAQANESLDNYLNEIRNSLQFIAINQDIISMLQTSTSGSFGFDLNVHRERISTLLNNIFAEQTDIKGYFIYNQAYRLQYMNSGHSINFDAPFLQTVWQDFEQTPHALKTKFYGAHLPDYYDNYSRHTDGSVITIAANIKNAYDPSDPQLYGVALFDYNISKLKTTFDTLKNRVQLDSFVMDDNRQIIYRTPGAPELQKSEWPKLFHGESGYFIAESGGSRMLVSYETSTATGWKTVILQSFSDFEKRLSLIRNTTILLIALMIAATIIGASVITIRTTRPLHNMVKDMQEIGRGNLRHRISRVYQYEEINFLNKGFNNMLDKINESIEAAVAGQLLQKEAEYEALQAKVNPHFLYNTLQSINSLAILERSQDIQRVTQSLRELLQYSLYPTDDMATIRDELESVRNYLRIQNIRYDGRLVHSVESDESLLSFRVNRFTLQPLIENAIYHGLESSSGAWFIELRVYREMEWILLEVADNGVGMGADKLAKLQTALKHPSLRSRGIGLPNIADRLQMKFGTGANLEVDSVENEGTRIRIRIPDVQPMYTTGGFHYGKHAADR